MKSDMITYRLVGDSTPVSVEIPSRHTKRKNLLFDDKEKGP